MKMNSNFSPSADRASEFLMSVHDVVPGITESVLGHGKTRDGRSSYEILADAAKLESGMTAVDLACGSGALTLLAAQKVGPAGRVFGIDLNRSELALAEARCGQCGNVRFLNESAAALSLPDASANAVLCHMALMLFQPVERSLAEIARILRPSGVLAAVIPGSDGGNLLFAAIRKALSAVVSGDVAPEKLVALGSPEFGSAQGIVNLFDRIDGFGDDVNFLEFDVIFRETPEALATLLMPFFYYSYLLSDSGRRQLAESWTGLFRQSPATEREIVEFRLPLTAFTIRKRR